jgi:hypothetical protein
MVNKGGRPKGRRQTLSQRRSSEGFYSHQEVANLLGLHPDTVHKLTRINRIPVEVRKKGLPDKSGNLRHDLFYPKDKIDNLASSLTTPGNNIVTQNPLTAKASGISQEDYVNGVGSLSCDRCGTDVPLKHAVSHDKMHRQQDLAGEVEI